MERFKNYVRRQPLENPYSSKVDDHLIYGSNDNFPLKLSKLVYESPAAASCISTISDFIQGDGFSTDIGKLVVNSQGQTLDEINHLCAESLAMYEGLSLNIKYTPEAKISQIFFVPFENCRLGIPDSYGVINEIKYNPYFGTDKYKQQKTETYYSFNPDPAVIMAQLKKDGKKFKGHIFYWGSTRALSRFYPQPSYYSAKNWMEVDARIGEFHKENLKNGFLQSAIFKLIGNPNAPATNPDDTAFDSDNNKQQAVKTIGEVFDEMMGEKFAGTERVGNIMAFWAQNKEEFPVVEPFPTSVNSQILDTLQNLTTKNITIATKVPAILANIHEGVSLGGDGNTIMAAVKLMQQRAAKWQAILEQTYKKIFKEWYYPVDTDFEIVDHTPFVADESIEDKIWEVLNTETKLNWIKKNTNIEIIESPTPTPQGPVNLLYTQYPQKARKNASDAIKWNEQKPGCGTKMGWDVAKTIAEGKPLSYKQVKRVRNFLVRNEIYKNTPFMDSCDAVLFAAWGGKDMLDWAEMKIKEVEE
jgi:hypothetical protein